MDTPANIDCPVDLVSVNEYHARIIAALVLLLALLFLYTAHWLIPALLCIDFFQRAFFSGRFSLLALVAAGIEKLFRIGYKATDQAPKRFAAQVGFLFSDMILICFVLDLTNAAIGLSVVLAVFAFLESVFAFCAGCHVYTFLRKLDLVK